MQWTFRKRASVMTALILVLGMAPLTVLAEGAAGQAAGMVRTETPWPTGDRSSSSILIERLTPAEVRAGDTFTYEIRLSNLTSVAINEVTLTEQLVPKFDVKSIEPKPTQSGEGTARWTIAKLEPSKPFSIRITGVATAVGTLAPCNTIVFSASACQSTVVVQPALKLVKTAPSEVILCDPIPIKVVITNTGSGSATDVKINDTLPAGWTTSDGKSAFLVNVGTLKAGESREASVEVRSSKTGTFTNEAVATEAGGLTAKASAQTVVRQPVLEVAKKGPSMVYVGRPVPSEIVVTNKGDAPAKNTVLVDTLDVGVAFEKASEGGQAGDGKVTWNLGTLNPGESKQVSVTCRAKEIKTVSDTAVATAYCAEAKASASTVVKGIPAILLEVEDIEDPIEVGANVTYVIAVTNQGSANDTNIKVKCTLPAEEEYVSAEGATKATAEGKSVTFAPLPSLAPKAKATYRVVVKGLRPADVRFAVELTSDMLTAPVNETESTHIY